MGIDITLRGAIIGLLIVCWIFGKALLSIPVLYRESKLKKGSETYGDLTTLLGFRVMGTLLFLGVFIWIASKLGYSLDAVEDIVYFIFVALFFSGFGSFLVLISTFIVAKFSKVQHVNQDIDVLDEKSNEKPS